MPAGNAATETRSVAGVTALVVGPTVSQPGGPEVMLAAAVKGTGGVLVTVIGWGVGIKAIVPEKDWPLASHSNRLMVSQATMLLQLLVKVTSVKPPSNVALMALPPVVPAGETALVTVYSDAPPSATVNSVPI